MQGRAREEWVGERYLEGLALWQAEDVLPYQKHLGRRPEKGGIRPFFVCPFFGRAGRPRPAEGSPSDCYRVIQAENGERHKCHHSKLGRRSARDSADLAEPFIATERELVNASAETGRTTSPEISQIESLSGSRIR